MIDGGWSDLDVVPHHLAQRAHGNHPRIVKSAAHKNRPVGPRSTHPDIQQLGSGRQHNGESAQEFDVLHLERDQGTTNSTGKGDAGDYHPSTSAVDC